MKYSWFFTLFRKPPTLLPEHWVHCNTVINPAKPKVASFWLAPRFTAPRGRITMKILLVVSVAKELSGDGKTRSNVVDCGSG